MAVAATSIESLASHLTAKVFCMDLAAKIRDVPDFPVKGILFKDITTLLQEGAAFRDAIDQLHARAEGLGVDVVVGMESRGFIFAAPLPYRLDVGFVPPRQAGATNNLQLYIVVYMSQFSPNPYPIRSGCHHDRCFNHYTS